MSDGDELAFDEATAREEEAAYRTPGAAERRRVVRESLALRGDETVVSVGPGPGFEPLEIAEELDAGAGGRVVGVDRSPAMRALARRRLADVPNATVVAGDAARLPVADGAADAAVSVQVFQYLDEVTPALSELARVLAPDGRAAVYLADWETFVVRGADPELTERVLAEWTGHCVRPTLASRLREHFDGVDLAVGSVEPYAVAEPDPTRDDFPRHLLDFAADRAAGSDAVGEGEARRWRDEVRTAAAEGTGFVSLTGFRYLLEPET